MGKASWATAAKRVRVSAQVKAAGNDGWAGLVVRDSFLPFYLLPVHDSGDVPGPAPAFSACADWCTVSAVADIPSDGMGAATVGVAFDWQRQVQARGPRLETVSADVPLTGAPFAALQTAALRAQMEQSAWPRPPSPRRPATSTCTELVAPNSEPRHGLPRPFIVPIAALVLSVSAATPACLTTGTSSPSSTAKTPPQPRLPPT